jgi:ABC-type lipoprotein export system ATPase subunit
MMDNKIVVEVKDLLKVYGDGHKIHALDHVSFTVHAGEFVSVMGPSGSGKSTLLNMLGALDRPTSGQVIINGQDMTTLRDVDSFRAKTVGFVFQLHNLIPTLSSLENVEVPMQGQGPGSAQRRKRTEELLTLVGLGDRLHHLPSQLSGGQRQKVAIARALANQPAILLADEPTGNLDSQSGDEVMKLLEDLHSEHGMTIFVVTHDMGIARRTHRVLVMRDGRIVREDIVGEPFEEDLKAFKHSGLGRALLSGVSDGAADSVDGLLTPADQAALRQVLSRTSR